MNIENRVGRWSLIIGIMIVLNLFFNYTLSLVYERPQYENFCPSRQVSEIVDTPEACVEKGGQWSPNSYYKPGLAEPRGYCDLDYTCREAYSDTLAQYEKNVFMILVVLGAVSIFLASFYIKNPVISPGLSLGGVFSFVIASLRYWSSADELFRVIILALALGLLFWIASKKFRD